MSYKIVQPSTNSDRVSRFGVSAGTSDSVITFPTDSGEVATTSDIPNITVPPATIYKESATSYTFFVSSSAYQTIPGTTITGLEPNYIYRLSLFADLYNTEGVLYHINWGMRILTQGGSQTTMGSVNPYTFLYLAPNGGFYGFNYDEYSILGNNKTFIPIYDNNIFSTFGWSIDIDSTENWDSNGMVNIQTPFITGTTADQCSLRVDLALKNSDGVDAKVRAYEIALLLEPIKPVVLSEFVFA